MTQCHLLFFSVQCRTLESSMDQGLKPNLHVGHVDHMFQA